MQRRVIFYLLVLGTMLPGVGAGAQTPRVLSLEEALASVENVSLNVLLGRELVSQAVALSQQQRAGVRPTVDFGVSQQRSRGVQVSGNQVNRGVTSNRFAGQLSGNYAVFDPARVAGYRASQIAVDVANLDYRETLQTILQAVAELYFTHLRNLRGIDVLDANIARSRELLRLARNQLEAGVATQIDVTRAESQLAVAEQARLQQETTVHSSALQLQQLLDLNLSQPLQLADFTVRRVGASAYAASLEENAFERRVDYLRAQRLREQNLEEVRAAKFERLPNLNLFGDYGVVSARAFDGREEEAWAAGLSLSVPVFDAGRSRSLQQLAHSRLRSQDLRLRFLDRQISAELRLALQDAGSRFAQVGVAEKSHQLAEEELRLAQTRFEQGVADNREIIEAQNRLAVASDNLVEAVYQYNLSRLELARARGEVREILAEKAP